MQATRLGVAFHQRLGLRIEVQQMHRQFLLHQLQHQRRQHLHAAGVAHIDADRDVAKTFRQELLDQTRQQLGRQVVHTIETGILQRLQRDALAGAGQAADQDELRTGHG